LEQEKGHGRIDKRSYKILPAEGNLTDAVAQRWPMVKSLIRVEHEVSKPNAQPKKETRYYISSPTTSRKSSDFDAVALGAWPLFIDCIGLLFNFVGIPDGKIPCLRCVC
jgi:hypothetical protein